MKKYLIAILLLLALSSCVKNSPNISSKQILIDIDKELELLESIGLRDNSIKVVDEPIYIGDNDEVSFKGNAMRKKSPLSIKVGTKKAIQFNGYQYTVKTMELRNGDFITIKDKNNNIFVEVEVIIQ